MHRPPPSPPHPEIARRGKYRVQRRLGGQNRGVQLADGHGGHQVRAIAATALTSALLLSPACGRLSNHFSKRSVTRKGTLTVSPPSGTAGTAFSLTAGGFIPGEPMTFEIDAPKQPRFVGPSHLAGADGRVTSTYTSQRSAPAGTYVVKAIGSRSTRAKSHLSIETGVTSTTRH
jgi:hypothetical protein